MFNTQESTVFMFSHCCVVIFLNKMFLKVIPPSGFFTNRTLYICICSFTRTNWNLSDKYDNVQVSVIECCDWSYEMQHWDTTGQAQTQVYIYIYIYIHFVLNDNYKKVNVDGIMMSFGSHLSFKNMDCCWSVQLEIDFGFSVGRHCQCKADHQRPISTSHPWKLWSEWTFLNIHQCFL